MTKLEKQYAQMSAAQKKKANAAISDMMGMPTKKKSGTRKSSTSKKK